MGGRHEPQLLHPAALTHRALERFGLVDRLIPEPRIAEAVLRGRRLHVLALFFRWRHNGAAISGFPMAIDVHNKHGHDRRRDHLRIGDRMLVRRLRESGAVE